MILEFLEQEELTVISAVHSRSDGRIRFHHRIPNEELCLLFYKVPQVGHHRKEDGSEPLLGILTLEGGMVKSIYNSVSRVFSPSANSARVSLESGCNDDVCSPVFYSAVWCNILPG